MSTQDKLAMAVDTLRPEVADAVSALDETTCMTNPGLKWYATIRAELLRLADENADYGKHAIEQYKRGVYWMDRAKEAEAELAALKARIAEAPVVACPKTLVHAGNTMQTEFLEYTHERMPGGCNSWAGKRVRLVVEE